MAQPDFWTERTTQVLSRYAEPLLREVAGRLVKFRTPLPPDELIEKILSTLANPPVVDRRIKDLPEASRKLLAILGQSRRPSWKVGYLLTLLASIGHPDGFEPVLTLLQAGLVFPEIPPESSQEIADFEGWLGSAGGMYAIVFAHPAVATRARGEDTGLPNLGIPEAPPAPPRQADGLDWPLRLAVAWQEVLGSPFRLTQGNALFKRDLARLQADEVLTAPPFDQLLAIPDPGVLAFFWAVSAGIIASSDGELTAGPFPPSWESKLTPTLADLWAGLTAIETWDPLTGYGLSDTGMSATPSAGLLATLLLAKSPANSWVDPQGIADWIWEHHPAWSGVLSRDHAKNHGRNWVEGWILGVLYSLRMVEAVHLGESDTDSTWRVRLTDLGRHLVVGGPEPAAPPPFPQTLLVQPNAEILGYRQGLTPALIGKLSRFAKWKGLGPACTLELTADHTYRGLESGMTLAGIVQTLNQHGMKPVPAPVADLLQRWANKRDRITVFAGATLVEFQSPADLDAAIARGIVSVRVTDRIGLTDDGREPEFKNLRLIGNRDYDARPQRCVAVGEDGLTLTIDAAQSDLLLEAEIGRLADPVAGESPGIRRLRLTPDSLKRATIGGYGIAELDAWFTARSGQPLSPAARLIVQGSTLPAPLAERLVVVKVPSEMVADGLMQWPPTRDLIAERLGPVAVVVDSGKLAEFSRILDGIGVKLDEVPDPA